MSTYRLFRVATGTAAATAAAVLAALCGSGVAVAHVTAQPGTATKGGYSAITFRVPAERADAGTVKVAVFLPTASPITSVSTKPLPGWTAEVVKAKLDQPVKTSKGEVTEAVRSITWTADPGTRIAPGQYQEFDISAGPLPDNTDTLVLPAVQTYDSGEVVRWDAQPAATGLPTPEHPAPVVKLLAKSATAGDAAASAPASADAPAPVGGADTTARWMGGAGLVLGALGLGFGGGAILRNRRPVGAASAADADDDGADTSA